MKDAFRSLADYEHFLYTLSERYPYVQSSTLRLIRVGATLARVEGEITFAGGYRVVVRERLTGGLSPIRLDGYGYELWRGERKLFWYDSQPHPGDAALQTTHPHHKHAPPDAKHNRVPAPAMSFA